MIIYKLSILFLLATNSLSIMMIQYPYDNQDKWNSNCINQTEQSPINIYEAMHRNRTTNNSDLMLGLYTGGAKDKCDWMVNSFSLIQIKQPYCSFQILTKEIDGRIRYYQLFQTEFHYRAEHTIPIIKSHSQIEEYQPELEIQLRFHETSNSRFYNPNSKRKFAIVSFLLSSQPQYTKNQEPFILTDNKLIQSHDYQMINGVMHDIFKNSSFYTYQGSNNYIDCSESYTYFVIDQIFYITPYRLGQFRKYIYDWDQLSSNGMNNRTQQKLYDRRVYYSKTSSFSQPSKFKDQKIRQVGISLILLVLIAILI